jgi:hypothetical protein
MEKGPRREKAAVNIPDFSVPVWCETMKIGFFVYIEGVEEEP